MAERVVEAIEAATNFAERRHDAGLVADLEIAMASALKGIDHARSRVDTRPSMGDTGYLGA
jgi:outer membrane protein TolC